MCVRAGAAVKNQEIESRHWCIFCLYSALWYQVVCLSCRTPPLLLWFHYIPVELCSNDDPSVAWHVQLWNVYLCLCNKHNAHVNVLQSGGRQAVKTFAFVEKWFHIYFLYEWTVTLCRESVSSLRELVTTVNSSLWLQLEVNRRLSVTEEEVVIFCSGLTKTALFHFTVLLIERLFKLPSAEQSLSLPHHSIKGFLFYRRLIFVVLKDAKLIL